MKLAVPFLEDLPDVAGKSVLVRTDYNVPLAVDVNGKRRVSDDFRIKATLPTLQWLLERGAKITIATHLGRPKGKVDPVLDLTPVRERLQKLLRGADFTMLDNVRFNPGEEANDPAFVQELIAGHDLFVNDAFGVSHRAHASVVGPPQFLPSAAGRVLEREVEVLSRLIESPVSPFVAIVGGSKVADKIGVLNALAERADIVIVGGGMAYTFLAAQGHKVGSSLLDESRIAECKALLEKDVKIVLPVDVMALGPGGKFCKGETDLSRCVGEVQELGVDIPDGWEGVDMGPKTRKLHAEVIASAKTVLWNGPVGVFEDPRFCGGTKAVADAVAKCDGFTVVGGGDSAAAVAEFGMEKEMDYISTGGGATLEYIEFGDLPGLSALRCASNAHAARSDA